MKAIYTLLLVFIVQFGFCQSDSTKEDSSKYIPSTLTAIQDGEFLDAKTYGGNLPKPGDNIIIPAKITVTVSSDVKFDQTNEASTIFISGALVFGKNGRLRLSSGSVIYGALNSFVDRDNKDASPAIKIGNATFYGGADSTMEGPLVFPAGIMPESFLNVTASGRPHWNVINWATIRECKAKSFEVFRSTNGATWESVGKVEAAGSRGVHTYVIKDLNVPPATCYYKIKAIDDTGKGQFSYIRSAKNIELKDNLSSR